MAIIGGIPAVCYEKSPGFLAYFYCRAGDPQGTTWLAPMLAFDDVASSIGNYARLVDMDGLPGIGCYGTTYSMPVFLYPVTQ